MLMSRPRNGGFSSDGEDSEMESMDSSVVYSPQWGFTGGGHWEMVMAYLMVAVDKHASLLLRLTQVGLGVDLVRSRVLPV